MQPRRWGTAGDREGERGGSAEATEAATAAATAAAPAAATAENQTQLSVFVQMEYYGLTLQRLAKEGRTLRIADVWRLFMQLLEAMVCVHRAGTCHRALHPSNVFLVEGPEGLIVKASLGSFLLSSVALGWLRCTDS
ncbi:uncharacterized protein EMH_0099660 [Eimeria mitis]|uniref:Protein kinase domain-containing protein n=1 Tax=Eimeria mitis TaxID=44415 RepID=U6KFV5_9EIME|nr:uncharacterized protein EMH_0099660 [Eimeria mitis]CDJ35676.1 hypothetical protein EMH_0099660 [Eimeria mitis]